ncbi:MAG TPA: LysR family transcriptional regulator [Rhodospirillum rubrum]|nr:LysR family transcriptional regulator [Rhodospirillum rubrum]
MSADLAARHPIRQFDFPIIRYQPLLYHRAMDLRQLRAFLAIVDSGGFSSAAERLHLTQPALSRQMRLLEEDLGERLLRRTGRGAEATAAGLVLADRARRILGEVEGARRALAARGGQVSGRVSLGLPPSVGVRLTAGVVTRLRAAHPLLGLTIVEELSGVVQDGLGSGWIDIGLLYAGAVGPALVQEPLLTEDLALIGRPDLLPAADLSAHGAPLALHRLADLPLLLPGRRHGLRALVDQAVFRLGITLDVAIEADSLRVLGDLAMRGLGLVVHAPSAFAGDLAAGLLAARPLGDPPLTRSIVLAWPRDRAASRAVLAVAEAVRSEVAALAGEPPL